MAPEEVMGSRASGCGGCPGGEARWSMSMIDENTTVLHHGQSLRHLLYRMMWRVQADPEPSGLLQGRCQSAAY